MATEQTNYERGEEKMFSNEAEEKSKPELSPVIGLKIEKDRARDCKAQESGEISRLYGDLSGGTK